MELVLYLIQLALDFIDKRLALKIAQTCLPYIDIIEAGTPLIKAEGIKIIKDLKKMGLPVAADLKTFDAGRLEVELAAEYGADYVTVLAAASDITIEEFLSACNKFDILAVADLMNSPVRRAIYLEQIGMNYIAIHSGIDEQRKGLTPFPILDQVRRTVKTPLVVAGG